MDLADVHKEVVDEIHFGLAQVIEAGPRAPLGDVFDSISDHFEALALCNLLEFANTHKFRRALVRSGHARRYYLRCCRTENATEVRHLARSRNRAFLAALAGGSMVVVRDIVAESTHPWNPKWEYEDDFAYREFLHTLAKQPSPFPLAELTALVSQFERALEGGLSKRYDVVKAILDRDAGALGSAIEGFLEDEERRIEDERESAAVHEREVLYWPNARVSVEGLALLKAGELASLAVPRELPLCPPLARLPWSGQQFRDLFDQIESGR